LSPDELLDAVARDPATAGLILDFDGTLAPIVDNPSDSALPGGLLDELTALGERLSFVAIVSGRPAIFLGERAAAPGLRLFGLYGTEEWRDGRAVAGDDALQWQPALDEARDRLALALAGHPGVVLEDKGLAIALHWRNAEDRDAAGVFVQDLVDTVADETGLAREPGKFVLELRPPLERDKGTCVADLVAQLRPAVVVYAGDDRGDLPAFAAAQQANGFAVVVDHGTETPADVLAVADVTLPGTDAMGEWLRDLRRRLD
jgi:trehalose 6-phosphate phosphatase